MDLFVVQPGYEAFLRKELNGAPGDGGPGWVLASNPARETCFAHWTLCAPSILTAPSVNGLAAAAADFFAESIRTERIDAAWPFVIEEADREGLPRRAKSIATELEDRLRARVSRVAKLRVPGRPKAGPARGLFLFLADFQKLYVTRAAQFHGPRRMADDPQAPSRSFLKVEEAYGILGREPAAEETVVDLGAAPGGWSYSAARRGARVTAVDNGPLKAGAVHPLITHLSADGFVFRPETRVDWMFCDMLAAPDRTLSLLESWLEGKWCRRFVVNVKFGRVDPLPLIRAAVGLGRFGFDVRVRHLFHDRDEFTVVGAARAA